MSATCCTPTPKTRCGTASAGCSPTAARPSWLPAHTTPKQPHRKTFRMSGAPWPPNSGWPDCWCPSRSAAPERVPARPPSSWRRSAGPSPRSRSCPARFWPRSRCCAPATPRRVGAGPGSVTAALVVPLSTAPGDPIAGVSIGADGLTGTVSSVAGAAEADVLVVPVAAPRRTRAAYRLARRAGVRYRRCWRWT